MTDKVVKDGKVYNDAQVRLFEDDIDNYNRNEDGFIVLKLIVKNRLKEILDNRGIKQVWLAEQVGISFKTLSNICNNRYNTSLEVAFKIAKVLDLRLEDIFKYEQEE